MNRVEEGSLMFETPEIEKLREGKRVQRTVYFLLLMTPVWFLIAIESGRLTPSETQGSGVMFWALVIVSIFTSLLTLSIHYLWVPKMMRRPLQKFKHQAVVTALNRLKFAMILCLAFAESIMIYGVVLYSLGGIKFQLYLFLVWGLVVMLLCFPFPRRNEEYAGFLKNQAQ